MRELEPGAGKRVGELVGILQETPRDLFVDRVEPQREIGRQHGRRDPLRRVVRVRHGAGAGAIFRLPLLRAGRALGQFPFVAEEVLEETVAPLRRRGGPGDFQAAGDRVAAFARAEAVLPAEALLFEAGRFRLSAPRASPAPAPWVLPKVWPPAISATVSSSFMAMRPKVSRMSFARPDRIGIAVRAFGVDVDQAHLHRGQRILQIARVDVTVRVVVGHEHGAVFLRRPGEPLA